MSSPADKGIRRRSTKSGVLEKQKDNDEIEKQDEADVDDKEEEEEKNDSNKEEKDDEDKESDSANTSSTNISQPVHVFPIQLLPMGAHTQDTMHPLYYFPTSETQLCCRCHASIVPCQIPTLEQLCSSCMCYVALPDKPTVDDKLMGASKLTSIKHEQLEGLITSAESTLRQTTSKSPYEWGPEQMISIFHVRRRQEGHYLASQHLHCSAIQHQEMVMDTYDQILNTWVLMLSRSIFHEHTVGFSFTC